LEFFEDQRLELYDLAADPSQQKNLASAEPQRTQLLHARLVAWRQAISARMPEPNMAKGNAKGKGKAADE
ncbi:MAG TPA: aryl-sulfate sulfohydrolase, partial [Planctomycetaceae bacterium]|nr:aryl-sulfate sulfohydrolase [Planctomycetaceae bacterium]